MQPAKTFIKNFNKFILIRITTIKKKKHFCWWECKMAQVLLKTVWQDLKILKRKLADEPGSGFIAKN